MAHCTLQRPASGAPPGALAIRDELWGRLPAAVVAAIDNGARPSRKDALCGLYAYLDYRAGRGGCMTERIARLSSPVGCSPRHLHSLIDDLVALGLLVAQRDGRGVAIHTLRCPDRATPAGPGDGKLPGRVIAAIASPALWGFYARLDAAHADGAAEVPLSALADDLGIDRRRAGERAASLAEVRDRAGYPVVELVGATTSRRLRTVGPPLPEAPCATPIGDTLRRAGLRTGPGAERALLAAAGGDEAMVVTACEMAAARGGAHWRYALRLLDDQRRTTAAPPPQPPVSPESSPARRPLAGFGTPPEAPYGFSATEPEPGPGPLRETRAPTNHSPPLLPTAVEAAAAQAGIRLRPADHATVARWVSEYGPAMVERAIDRTGHYGGGSIAYLDKALDSIRRAGTRDVVSARPRHPASTPRRHGHFAEVVRSA